MKYTDYMAEMQRADDAVGTADLIAAYEQEIADLRYAVAGMTAEQVFSRPIPGKWSTLEVVAHLAGTEIYYTDRIERTIALERPLLIGVDERLYPALLTTRRSTSLNNSTCSRPCVGTGHASCGRSRPKCGSVSAFSAKPALSPCGNWCSRR